MKKFIIALAIALLSYGSAFAAPQFKGLSNKHGKTTITIEVPASDRGASDCLGIDDIRLHNNGETYKAKKVKAIWGKDSTITLEFEKQKTFEGCTLTLTLNGVPVSMDIQSQINR